MNTEHDSISREKYLVNLGKQVEKFHTLHLWRQVFDVEHTASLAELFSSLRSAFCSLPEARPLLKCWHAILLPLAYRTLARKIDTMLLPKGARMIWVSPNGTNWLPAPYFQKHFVMSQALESSVDGQIGKMVNDLVGSWLVASIETLNGQGEVLHNGAKGYAACPCPDDFLPPLALILPDLTAANVPDESKAAGIALLTEMAAVSGIIDCEESVAEVGTGGNGAGSVRFLMPGRPRQRSEVVKKLSTKGTASLHESFLSDGGEQEMPPPLEAPERIRILDMCRRCVEEMPTMLRRRQATSAQR